MPSVPTTVVWFRLDLRSDDHEPLVYAAERGRVVPVYILDAPFNSGSQPERLSESNPGRASKWWLHNSLKALAHDLEERGSPLLFRIGNPFHELLELCNETGADQIAIHESIDPISQNLEDTIDDRLGQAGVELIRFSPNLLWPPGTVYTNNAKPYQVFTPFWNKASLIGVPKPIPAPDSIKPPRTIPEQHPLATLDLLDSVDWAAGLRNRWSPGESGAKASLNKFLSAGIDRYHLTRDQLDQPGWSALSAPLHFGELSARRLWHNLQSIADREPLSGVAAFQRQLGWRDFAAHLMNHFPHTTSKPFRDRFSQFPWSSNKEHFTRWKHGCTGYPIVDAAMRNLWAEGWMPNRARMIAASFLCKHLLISWEKGARWFMDTLVDADLCNNTFGWQWIAGCGADAAPYFRIFNPITQSQKFDPGGEYIRRWVPELARLSNKLIHTPWTASEDELEVAGVRLGVQYPSPIVDHQQARASALDAYATI